MDYLTIGLLVLMVGLTVCVIISVLDDGAQ
jgi:hypothetical protein